MRSKLIGCDAGKKETEVIVYGRRKQRVKTLYMDNVCMFEKGEVIQVADFSINEMLEMQRSLQDKYKDKWEPICVETGKNKLLWMVGEIGEVIDIVKKNGGEKATSDAELRKNLVEEMADVLMHYNDVMLCYGITADELKQAYTEKFQKNMKRW